MILGIAMTVLNLVLNVVLIRGLGPIPAFGTAGVGDGDGDRVGARRRSTRSWKLWRGGWVVSFPRGHGFGPDWTIIRSLFRFGLPTGIQGIAMNVGGVLMLGVHRLAGAERGGAGGVRGLLHAALLADHLDVGRADGRGRGGRRPEPRRGPARTAPTRRCTSPRAIGLAGAAFIGRLLPVLPAAAARRSSA